MNAPARSVVLDEIAAAIGAEATYDLARALGGRRIYVPREIGPGHPIAVAIGGEAAALLADHFYGTDLNIPIRQGRAARVHALAAREPRLTIGQIAAEVGITERGVQKILARELDGAPKGRAIDSRQIDMFS
jgi:hypothetical protein